MTKFALLFTLMLGLFTADVPKLVKTKVAGSISIGLPETFRAMTDQEIAGKYFTYRKPTAMFTDTRSSADLGINMSECEWKYEDLDILKSFYRSSIQKMFSSTKMIKDEIRTIGGQRFIVFEFVSEVAPDKYAAVAQKPVQNYNYLLYTIQKDQLILFNFTCPVRYQEEWAPVADAMMNSVSL